MQKLTYIDEDTGETFEVEYTYYPGRKGVHTLSNGDPGYPDDPPEIDWTVEGEVTPEQSEAIEQAIWRDIERNAVMTRNEYDEYMA